MIRLSGRGDTREMGGKVDETRFSGTEPWKNSTSPYQESPWQWLDPSYIISNGIRRLSPYTQTNSPLEPPANSIPPLCSLNSSASPEPNFHDLNCIKFVSK